MNHSKYPNFIFSRCILHAFVILSIASCSKDDFIPGDLMDPEWSPEIAMPLAYTEVGIDDLAHINDTSTIIVVDPDQFCTLLYKGRIFEMDGKQLIGIPDQVAGQTLQLNNAQISTLNSAGQVTVSSSQTVAFSVSQGVEIDSVILASGMLVFEINSQLPVNSTVRLTIPSMKNAGNAFTRNIDLVYNGTTPIAAYFQYPLTDYNLDLTQAGTTHNSLQVQLVVTFQGNGSQVSNAQSLQTNLRFTNVDYHMVYGYAGQQSLLSPADSVGISIFRNAWGSGSFSVVNPTITFDISNSVGIPFFGRVQSLTGMNQNMTSFIACSGIPDPLPLVSPSPSQIGQTLHSGFSLNDNNSNIQSMIQNNPAWLITSTQTSTNPAGHALNFIPGDSKLAIDMTLSLPLHGTASDFVIRDTLPFTYSDLEKVESITIRLGVENWFPIESNARLIFTDSLFIPLDSAFTDTGLIIPSGKIKNNSDRVSIPGYKIADEKLDLNRINKIKNASNIIVETTATTLNNGNTDVKIFHDYRMKVNVGARIKLKVK